MSRRRAKGDDAGRDLCILLFVYTEAAQAVQAVGVLLFPVPAEKHMYGRRIVASAWLVMVALFVNGCGDADPLLVSTNNASPNTSVVTVDKDVVEAGTTANVLFRARDASGNDLTTGGLTVVFTRSGGTSLGSFSATVDNGDGTYQATFTGTVAGSPTTIGATMNGQPVTSTLPVVQVVPPTQTGPGICEAVAPGRCWYVAAFVASGGSGTFEAPFRTPQQAVNQAGPGDVIYLRGGVDFTHDHANGEHIIAIVSASDGEPDRPITLKSYPGEQAVIRGRFENLGDLVIQTTRSHWRIEGLRMYNGRIIVGHGTSPGAGPRVRNVWVVGNTITDVVARWSNYGVITVHGQHTQGGPGTWDDDLDPAEIFIYNNTIRTVWAMQTQTSTQPVPWYEDADPEHNACLALLKSGGLVEVVGNDFSECPNIFYSKWNSPGPTLVRDNYFHTALQIANKWRGSQPLFENNVFARFARPSGSFFFGQGEVEGIVFRNNTFDFGPWARNPGGPAWPVHWNELGGHTFRDNVILGREYHRIDGDFSGNNINGNCVLWNASLVAARGTSATYTWEQYRSAFGYDQAAVRVAATAPGTVFADPANGDYTLIGQAAQLCGGKGAGG